VKSTACLRSSVIETWLSARSNGFSAGEMMLLNGGDGPGHVVLGVAELLGDGVRDGALEALAVGRVVVGEPRLEGWAVGADRELAVLQRLQGLRRAVPARGGGRGLGGRSGRLLLVATAAAGQHDGGGGQQAEGSGGAVHGGSPGGCGGEGQVRAVRRTATGSIGAGPERSGPGRRGGRGSRYPTRREVSRVAAGCPVLLCAVRDLRQTAASTPTTCPGSPSHDDTQDPDGDAERSRPGRRVATDQDIQRSAVSRTVTRCPVLLCAVRDLRQTAACAPTTCLWSSPHDDTQDPHRLLLRLPA
jgi:hypothetical protein